jgi:hypothetical protein
MERAKIQRKENADHEQSAINSSSMQQTKNTHSAQAAETQMPENLEPQYAHDFANISVFAPEHTVQRKAAPKTTDATEPNLNARIQASAGSGTPLESTIQTQLETGIGADLSSVRVHTDSEANKLSHELHANAFTTGNDIYFRQGLYNPNSSDGMRLLAHEATHTVQQANGAVDGVSWGGGVKVSDPNDRFEQAAEATANNFVNSSPVGAMPTGGSSGAGVVQREAVVEEDEKEKLERPEEEKELQMQRDSSNTLAIQRDPPGWSGPSYARHGPDDSKVEQRRASLKMPGVYTQEYDNSCLEGSKKIVSGLETLYSIATDLEKRAESGSIWKANDKDLLALAKQVRDLTKGVKGMKEGLDTLRAKGFDFSTTKLETDPQLPSLIDTAKGSIDSITQAFDTNEALKAFQDKPSRETANAWATQVTNQFSAAKGLLAGVKLPPGLGWIKEYFEGLLGAPAVYVSAFQKLSKLRYDALDKEAGISEDNEGFSDDMTRIGRNNYKSGGVGGGPMRLIRDSWGASAEGTNFYTWLTKTKSCTFNGSDFQEKPPSLDIAKTFIVQELDKEESFTSTQKAQWTAWVLSYNDPGPSKSKK